MKTILSLLFVLFCSLVLISCQGDGRDPGIAAPTTPVPSANGESYVPDNYSLVWNDEFEGGPLPDTSRWGYQKGGHGWTAKELQMYKEADPTNVGVEDGLLRISLTREVGGAQKRNPFASTRLVTKRKADFFQGYFEVRAKFPAGSGLRSAIWMVGDTVSKIGWPNAGEIDLVEHYGKIPTAVGSAVQTIANYWNGKGQMGGATIVSTATEDFHVYSCTWTEDLLTFAVDGKPYWEYRPIPGQGVNGWPFQWPFYMVINLSTGGERGASKVPNEELLTVDYPANLYVDYVRVYQKQ